MTSIHMQQNQYRGINAHLQSHLQRSGGWAQFHEDHMNVLLNALQEALPQETGYICKLTRSIQVAQYDLLPDQSTIKRSAYNPSNYQIPHHDLSQRPIEPMEPSLVFPVTNLFTEEEINSIVIYSIDQAKPITRIELLTPASKSPGSHYHPYLISRSAALRSQVRLVEIDYLHERRSPIMQIPDYTNHEDGAFPFSITVSHLQLVNGTGYTHVYGFHVEDPIPIVPIPLDDNILSFDFGAVYHQTFTMNSLNGLRYVDYGILPDGFESYSLDDQERIKVRMELVRSLHA